jgi:uncharacterized protein
LKAYSINIIGLSNKIHHFDFEIGSQFFDQYGKDLVSEGSFTADIELNKHETFIEAEFNIKGSATLICDRSLDSFDHPVKVRHKIVFKFGDEDKEVTDEIMIINRDTVSLNVGQYIYEFISLAIPMKKLHPRFKDEDDESDGRIIYSSEDDITEEQNDIDPRWEQLKKLK